MKVRFIINPLAGGKARATEITNVVRELLAGMEGIFEIKVPRTRGGAQLFSREARDRGFDAVFACGGDGTINEVATPLVGSSTALGVVPVGSGNGFALSMGIPTNIRDAITTVKRFRTRLIDVGEVCGRYFFSTAGVGFDAVVSKRYNEGAISSKKRGLAPYAPLAIKEFLRYRPEPVVIKMDNESMSVIPLILTVANTERYGGGAVIAPGAKPDDGFLDVAIVEAVGIFRAAGLGWRLMKGNIDKSSKFKYFRTQHVEILRYHSAVLHADGEPFEWGGSIIFRVHPKALKLIID